jgi:Fic family protein
MTTEQKVAVVEAAWETHGLNRALAAVDLAKSTWYYHRTQKVDYEDKYAHLQPALEEIARKHPEYGILRTTEELRDSYGRVVNHKVVQRLHQRWQYRLLRSTRRPKPSKVRQAIVEAQFELIHPFQDGNGRLGRMLVPIFLFEKALLSSPTFYLSAYLEEHREVYYHRLQAISQEDDWNGWVAFFLIALVEQARSNSLKTRKIMLLYERMKEYIPQATRSQYAIQAIDALFDRPIFQTSDFAARAGVSKSTADRILRKLKETGIVHELRPRRGRRAAVMVFRELVQIVEE